MIKLKCPVCGEVLFDLKTSIKCKNGHSFDRAASGYFNLHLNKHSKTPGDSREMVLARRRFLDAGYYAPLRDKLLEIIKEKAPTSLVDAGCGEGYYTSEFSKICETLGVDLSKDAILKASKKDKLGTYCVASIFDIPVMDASADLVTSIFAPYSSDEFARVSNAVLAVIPGERHLFGLKEILYDSPYLNDEEGYNLPEFTLRKTTEVDFEIAVEGEQAIFDLFSMTPYYWKTPRDAVERLKKVNSLKTDVLFRILYYKKNRS